MQHSSGVIRLETTIEDLNIKLAYNYNITTLATRRCTSFTLYLSVELEEVMCSSCVIQE